MWRIHWCARNKVNKHHLKIWENRRATADTWWGRQPKAKKSYNWELRTNWVPVPSHSIWWWEWWQPKKQKVTNLLLKHIIKLDREYKRCCIWTFFPVFQMFAFFQCLQARLESLLAHKRESFTFYMASPDHTFRKKQGQFFFVISVHQLLRASNPKQLHQDLKDG